MNKETFHTTWYYRLLRAVFWGSLITLSGGLILLGLTEDDIPAAGFFWAGVVAFVYWLAKRIFYTVLFREHFLPQKNKR